MRPVSVSDAVVAMLLPSTATMPLKKPAAASFSALHNTDRLHCSRLPLTGW